MAQRRRSDSRQGVLHRPDQHRRSGSRDDNTKSAAVDATQWIYGRHAVTAALANPGRDILRFVSLSENAEEAATLLAQARTKRLPARAETVERRALEALLPGDAVHQGLALEAKPLEETDLEDVLAALPEGGAPHILVVLDQVTDPHNVGAILRSAAAFAALAVVVPEHGAPPITGTLAKAASGALEIVPFVRVTNLSRTLERVKEAGFWCVGLDSDASDTLATLALPDRIALVLGAEGAGLRRLVREQCDYYAKLPMRGALHSLNVSNAAAVALYALTQNAEPQRRK